jgi:hypothetical protein
MIYLLWGTIRPKMFRETHKYWMDRAKHPENIINKVVVPTQLEKKQLKEFDVLVEPGNNKNGWTYGTYMLTKNLEINDDDIIMLPTDDTYCPKNWDEYVLSKFKNWDGALLLPDGTVHTDLKRYNDATLVEPLQCLIMACMTFKCLKKLNKCIFSPHYHHFFGDPEAYQNLYHMGLLKDVRCDQVIFEHRHYYQGKRKKDLFDETHYDYKFKEDENMFWRRMKMSLQERLDTLTAETPMKTDSNVIKKHEEVNGIVVYHG